MCSQDICVCPTEATKIWVTIPEEELRSYGRINSWAQATDDEFLELQKKGPYDASVVALHFEDSNKTVNTYGECYNNVLKPMYEKENNKTESEKDSQLQETMKLVDKFFNQGGYEFL